MRYRENILLSAFLVAALVSARAQSTSLVNRTVDEAQKVTLHGTVSPLVRNLQDRGPVAQNLPAGRMLLLLNRPADRAAALEQYLRDAHMPGSAAYHQWLKPEQFGQRFGASDQDVAVLSQWLGAHGLNTTRVSKGRQFVELTGSIGQVNSAFGTSIHEYFDPQAVVKPHYANATELHIPAALAGLIRGVGPLNDFRPQPALERAGRASYSSQDRRARAEWTDGNPNGPGDIYIVAPEDFATQYDITPLYKAGVTGAGQTIGIINASNIDVSLVNAYRSLYGLAANAPQVVVDGSDMGLTADSIEAYLDVEEAGAVAPGATILLYESGGSLVADPLYLAALRAVDDNQASVLSLSFSGCEGFMAAENQTWAGLWEQASAQGQTVVVSSGDSGSAACDPVLAHWGVVDGLQVNGLASTPWNVAVGGTDFFYSDYASGAPSMASLWNATNDPGRGSLKAPLPEQVWDTAFGLNAIPYVRMEDIPAGGGGASACINPAPAQDRYGFPPFVCQPIGAAGSGTGYPKPVWQTGPGVPADAVRDIPDVSLFAAPGKNRSMYAICANEGDCVTTGSQIGVELVGGTSASTPAMAGIFALVNQQYGRQGQANFTLYALAQQQPAAFHDVTVGTNDMVCAATTANCTPDSTGSLTGRLEEYAAGKGYDPASGLGSIDANVLVSKWNSLTFKQSTTSLTLGSTTPVQGIPLTANASVSGSGGTPQGAVTILANAVLPGGQGLGVITLSKGNGTTSLNNLPGGTYQLWAQYDGDGVFAGSKSAQQTITVAQAPGSLTLQVYGVGSPGFFDPALNCNDQLPFGEGVAPGQLGNPSGTPYLLGSPLIVNAQGPGPQARGNVTFSLDGQPAAVVALDQNGYASWAPSQYAAAGTHAITAAYSGDSTFGPATAAPYSYTLMPGRTYINVWPQTTCTLTSSPNAQTCSFNAANPLKMTVQLQGGGCMEPTGTMSVTLGSTTQSVTLTPEPMAYNGLMQMSGTATFSGVTPGTYSMTDSYAGDSNYKGASGVYGGWTTTVTATAPTGPLTAATVTLSNLNPTSTTNCEAWCSPGGTVDVTVTGLPGGTTAPTGTVTVFANSVIMQQATLAATGPDTSSAPGLMLDLFFTDWGQNQITAVYSGDGKYQSATSAPLVHSRLYSNVPDFTMATAAAQMKIHVGSSGQTLVELGSLVHFAGTVTVTCAPSSSAITCNVSPATAVVKEGAFTQATLTIGTAASAARPAPASQARLGWGALVLGCLLGAGFKRIRRMRGLLVMLTLVAVWGMSACGGSGGSGGSGGGGTGGTGGTPAARTYSVVVSGASGGLVHTAVIIVVVQ